MFFFILHALLYGVLSEVPEADLLSFLTPDFFEKTWERKPHHFTLRSDEVKKGFSLSDFRKALKYGIGKGFYTMGNMAQAQHGTLQEGTDVYFYNIDLIKRITIQEMFEVALKHGGTTVLLDADAFHDGLHHMTVQCSHRVLCPCGMSVYVTAAGTHGVNPHFDTMDVVAFQTSGRKVWSLYDPSIVHLPRPDQRFELKPSHSLGRREDYDVQSGDILYVPRGVAHNTTCVSTDPCVHMSLGIECLPTSSTAAYLHTLLACEGEGPLRGSEDRMSACPAAHIVLDILSRHHREFRSALKQGPRGAIQIFANMSRATQRMLASPDHRVLVALMKLNTEGLLPLVSHLEPWIPEEGTVFDAVSAMIKTLRVVDWSAAGPHVRVLLETAYEKGKGHISDGTAQEWLRSALTPSEEERDKWYRMNHEKMKEEL